MKKRTERLGQDQIPKLLMEFSIPATVGMLVNALYNIVDRMYIGNSPDLGALGIAGITITFPITLLLMSTTFLFSIGGSTLFSIHLGKEKPEEAKKYFGSSILMIIIVSLGFMAIGINFLDPILKLFGASQQILPYAHEYMNLVLYGSVFQGLSMGFNAFIRADGSPKTAMISMFIGAGFNIVFDPIFIYVFKWGMTGAALATIGGQIMSTLWVLSYFFSDRCNHRLELKYLRFGSRRVAQIMRTGVPSFLRQIANSLVNIIINISMARYGGDIAVSGMGIINSVQTLMIMPVFGIIQGTQPIIGYNFGARKFQRVKEALKLAIFVSTAIVSFGWLITRLFPDVIIRLFSKDIELIEFGTHAVKAWFLCLPVVGFQVVSTSYFQAVGKAKSAAFLTSTRQLLFLIPAVLVLPVMFGVDGILYAAPFADIMSAIITGGWLFKEFRSVNVEVKDENSVL